MIFAIRADAGVVQGTGHVMRCLSLAERLLQRGHRVGLFTNSSEIPWLESAIEKSGVEIFRVAADELDAAQFAELKPNWLIVDSYRILASEISSTNRVIPVLAIVDGNTRGIEATAYLDTNLFSEKLDWPDEIVPRLLAGSSYALVRDEVLATRREKPAEIVNNPPKILVFLGGSDPYGYSPLIARALAMVETDFQATLIAPATVQPLVLDALESSRGRVEVISPTPKLASYYRNVDVVISAAGTSAWDVCTLGIPALLLAVVDNQEFSVAQISEHRLTLTNNLAGADDSKAHELAEQVHQLLTNQNLREELSKNALSYFDGLGRDRVEAFLTGKTS